MIAMWVLKQVKKKMILLSWNMVPESLFILIFKEGSSASPIVGESHVNVMAHHTVFINSNLGMHSDSVGPMGQTSIARKVVIDQPPGGTVNDYHSSGYDYINSRQEKYIKFQQKLAISVKLMKINQKASIKGQLKQIKYLIPLI